MKQLLKNYWAIGIPVIIIIVALIFFLKPSVKEKEDAYVIGMVDATSIDVAAELPGRLDSLMVAQGDTVQKGQLLGVLRSNEIAAVRKQALAGSDAAQAWLQLLTNGPRPELVQATNKLYQVAEEQYALFSNTYQRMEKLYNAEVISGQEKDVFYFKYQAAKKEMETAKLNLEMLQQGTRPELLKSAAAIARQAQEAYRLTSLLQEHTRMYAPATGTITTLVIHEGEMVSMGYPVMSIEKENSFIIRFNVRQDKAAGLTAGKPVKVKVPGCHPEIFETTVSAVAPSLEFANWVPAKDRGQFELRTFAIEVKPAHLPAVQGLRSGMTAALLLPE